MEKKAIQEFYPDNLSYCYGCGRLNDYGLKIKSYWEGNESVCRFQPKPYHTAFLGFVYGGLLASLIDCHGTGTAAAAGYRVEGREMGTKPELRYVTASLHVDFLKPTPIGVTLELRGKVKEIKGKKTTVIVSVRAQGEECVRGEVVAVRIPESMIK